MAPPYYPAHHPTQPHISSSFTSSGDGKRKLDNPIGTVAALEYDHAYAMKVYFQDLLIQVKLHLHR